MEVVSKGKVEVRSNDAIKKKKSWGTKFYSFLASGGIIVLVVVGFILAIIVSILIQ